ncbi:type VII secretion protein EccCa [Mycobacterium simiae]|uniref:Type VII secretion protein EccCa n=1 Tax=Mycobacterium simiae TaxID=1784 RepID=A0A5B1BLW5_MYCSI|nr:type VII secretion protein EccCa [Mycobacterium simiae]KAA1248363.1 type VII secretion protein EccCa [Mycobacterium simiae]
MRSYPLVHRRLAAHCGAAYSPATVTTEVLLAAPPEVVRPAAPGLVARLLPVGISAAALGVTASAFLAGAPATRNPTFLTFPVLMVASLVVTAVTGRGRRHAGIDSDRLDYLEYLAGLRRSIVETAVAQRSSLNRTHPDPDLLWSLVGGPQMWEQRVGEIEVCRIRVGLGTVPLATRLVAPQLPPGQRSDPVTVAALRCFLRAYSTLGDAPVVVPLRGGATVQIDGESTRVRGLLRAMVCQLAVLYAPDQVMIAAVISGRHRMHWDWLKWLPHNQHPSAVDAVGSLRMVYPTWAQARAAHSGANVATVVIADTDEPAGNPITGAIVLQVGSAGDGPAVVVRDARETHLLERPDQMDPAEALACARRLAACQARDRVRHSRARDWASLIGAGHVAALDPAALWRNQTQRDRLRVPIGTTVNSAPMDLDIKEPAEHGMGPHGLCVGATGSGKSELLRTVVLGMMTRHSPAELNLLLIDFKGGATFLDFAGSPHVAAVITNLCEEAPLVDRMHEALAGEMNRRQQLLRKAGNLVSVAAYQNARRADSTLAALPTLFIVVDEFSELLSQHPDFADAFLAIGRLGRSLGMHLLLASQRLDEGRMRGLDAHLSYRICLKTLSASDSRTVLGTLDGYELPNTPGAGWLRTAAGELIRFQSAFVSQPLWVSGPVAGCSTAPQEVRVFTAQRCGPAVPTVEAGTVPAPSVLQLVLGRLAGHGPPAHRVWLPPLESAPPLDTLLSDGAQSELAVPIGIVDRPFEQARTALIVDLSAAAGNVAVVGAPHSGKSSALCTLITALAATHDPGQVQFYCLDFGGGTLATVRELPHVGAVAGRSEPELVWRTVAQLESTLRTRESLLRGQGPVWDRRADVFLVVDGWAALRHEFDGLEDSIIALAAQGLSFGMHVVVSASRWAEIRPALKDQIGTRLELRLGDPADSEVDRRKAQQVPRDRPGRGLSLDGWHMMIALPTLRGLDLRRGDGDAAAPAIPLLPARVDYDSVLQQADAEDRSRLLIGIDARRLQPAAVDFGHQPHLLVLGDNGCGKSAALRILCREIVRSKTPMQAQLFLADFRRALLGVIETEHLGGYAMSAPAVAAWLPGLVALLQSRMPPAHVSQTQLRARSWWSGPEVYVVVDDYDLVATATGNPLLALLEYVPYAVDLGLHLIVARRSAGAARALFEPLLAGLYDFGCMALMMSGRPEEGVLLGSGRPGPLPPGRGILSSRAGDEQLVQVAWSPQP